MSTHSFLHLAFQFDNSGSGKPCPADQIEQRDDKSWFWFDLDYATPEGQQWIVEHSQAPDVARRAMFENESRPGVHEFSEGLLVILRGVNLNEGARPEDMISIRIWIEPRLVITCHRRKLRSVQSLADRAPSTAMIRTPGELFSELVGELSTRIVSADDKLASRLALVEQNFEKGAAVEHELGEIRRVAAGLKRYLGPQKEALVRLQNYKGELLSPRELDSLRLPAHLIIQSLDDIEFIREQVLSFQDELNNRMVAAQNSRMYLLSIVAAIFLPLTFVTGLLGMNVGGIPWAASPQGFGVIVGVSVAVALGLLIYFKTRKWF